MEWSTRIETDVSEWRKQQQIAYWKSRALSTELENQMLLEHLRNAYAALIQERATRANLQNEPQAPQHNDEPEAMIPPTSVIEVAIEDSKENSKAPIPTIDSDRKTRKEHLKSLFGDKASRIIGMETAVQLNFDLRREEAGKISHWPHLPLRCTFD